MFNFPLCLYSRRVEDMRYDSSENHEQSFSLPESLPAMNASQLLPFLYFVTQVIV